MIFMAVSSVMYLGHSWDGSKPLTCLPLEFLAVIGVVWKGNGQRGRVVLLGSRMEELNGDVGDIFMMIIFSHAETAFLRTIV